MYCAISAALMLCRAAWGPPGASSGVRDIVCGWYGPHLMSLCSSCERPATTRHGRDGAGRQRFLCRPCRRTFTAASVSACSGYRWPPEVLLTAVRWSLSHPLSGTSVMVLLADRGIDVSKRTVRRWVQTFGPLLAAEVRRHRQRPGRTWSVDEVCFFRDGGKEKRSLYRAIDEHG